MQVLLVVKVVLHELVIGVLRFLKWDMGNGGLNSVEPTSLVGVSWLGKCCS